MFHNNIAVFFDENGDYLGKKRFNFNKETLDFSGRTYQVRRKGASFFRRTMPPPPLNLWGILDIVSWDYYFYSYDRIEPHIIKHNMIDSYSQFSPADYSLNMKHEFVKELKKALENKPMIDIKKVLIGLGVIAVVIVVVLSIYPIK